MDSIFSMLSSGAHFKKKRKASVPSASDAVSDTPLSGDIPKITSEDSINELRNRLQIRVKGSDIPAPNTSFKDMNISSELKPVLLSNIENSDWKEPTAIQMQAIPIMLQNRDILASAPTGSGKTASFVIPTLSKLQKGQKSGVRALLLAPTRELAEQIHRETCRLCAGKRIRIGIVKKSNQTTDALQGQATAYSKYDLLVSTPMRIVALLRAKGINLANVETVVLDEADKLFEMEGHMLNAENSDDEDQNDWIDSKTSFLSQVDEILSQCGTGHDQLNLQRALFSATIGPLVQELANSFLKNPVSVHIGVENAGALSITQKLQFVGREDGKALAIRQLVTNGELRPPVLLFLQSKDRAKELYKELAYDGIKVDVMHSDRTQAQRETIINNFRTGVIWVLICTDLMARGLDFKAVKMVINYDVPQSPVSYIHRIGRTGRAGRSGTAITFFTEADIPNMRSIANVMKLSGCDVPDWLLSVKQLSTKQKRRLRVRAPERASISSTSNYDKKKIAKKKRIIEQSKQKKRRTESQAEDT